MDFVAEDGHHGCFEPVSTIVAQLTHFVLSWWGRLSMSLKPGTFEPIENKKPLSSASKRMYMCLPIIPNTYWKWSIWGEKTPSSFILGYSCSNFTWPIHKGLFVLIASTHKSNSTIQNPPYLPNQPWAEKKRRETTTKKKIHCQITPSHKLHILLIFPLKKKILHFSIRVNFLLSLKSLKVVTPDSNLPAQNYSDYVVRFRSNPDLFPPLCINYSRVHFPCSVHINNNLEAKISFLPFFFPFLSFQEMKKPRIYYFYFWNAWNSSLTPLCSFLSKVFLLLWMAIYACMYVCMCSMWIEVRREIPHSTSFQSTPII